MHQRRIPSDDEQRNERESLMATIRQSSRQKKEEPAVTDVDARDYDDGVGSEKDASLDALLAMLQETEHESTPRHSRVKAKKEKRRQKQSSARRKRSRGSWSERFRRVRDKAQEQWSTPAIRQRTDVEGADDPWFLESDYWRINEDFSFIWNILMCGVITCIALLGMFIVAKMFYLLREWFPILSVIGMFFSCGGIFGFAYWHVRCHKIEEIKDATVVYLRGLSRADPKKHRKLIVALAATGYIVFALIIALCCLAFSWALFAQL